MTKEISEIETPSLALDSADVAEHCQALRQIQRLSFWWYQGSNKLFGNFSLPFQDKDGNWWYQVKPGLCWTVDCFRPIEPSAVKLPYGKSFLGCQHVVPSEELANSHLVINAIPVLSSYGAASIDAKRRNAIRKGLRSCQLAVETTPDDETLRGCLQAWNDLSQRTGWKHALDEWSFTETWPMFRDLPGTSIIVGRESESGEIAGFLVTKIIGDTAYVDTIASRSDLLRTNVNDALMYAFLINAARVTGVCKAHYAIKSNVEPLERFKTGLGFHPHAFPARTSLRPGVGLSLKLLCPAKHKRMTGQFD